VAQTGCASSQNLEEPVGVSLAKGQSVSLAKEDATLDKALIGLGWDVNSFTGADYDLDAVAILVGPDGKVGSTAGKDGNFVFYNQLRAADGESVIHNGDNRTGEGEGDDETLEINLSKVPSDVEKIVIAVTIHDGQQKGQSFGAVRSAFVRVVNANSNAEVLRYDLSEDASTEVGMVFAEISRKTGEWKFRAVGQGYADGLAGIARDFGISV
jgi:tellurium resistance protein TerD